MLAKTLIAFSNLLAHNANLIDEGDATRVADACMSDETTALSLQSFADPELSMWNTYFAMVSSGVCPSHSYAMMDGIAACPNKLSEVPNWVERFQKEWDTYRSDVYGVKTKVIRPSQIMANQIAEFYFNDLLTYIQYARDTGFDEAALADLTVRIGGLPEQLELMLGEVGKSGDDAEDLCTNAVYAYNRLCFIAEHHISLYENGNVEQRGLIN